MINANIQLHGDTIAVLDLTADESIKEFIARARLYVTAHNYIELGNTGGDYVIIVEDAKGNIVATESTTLSKGARS